MRISDILSVSFCFSICTGKEETRVDGHLLFCSPVLYFAFLGSLIYVDGVCASILMYSANRILAFASYQRLIFRVQICVSKSVRGHT